MSALMTIVWLAAWGFAGLSVVLASTSGAPGGPVDALLQSVGRFYLDTVATLQEFATLTALGARATDAGYALLSTVPLGLHVFVSVGAAGEPGTMEVDGGDLVFFLGTLVGLFAVLGALAFGFGAELLAVSLIGVGIAVVLLVVLFVVEA